MQQPKIGLQLIVYGPRPEEDLAGVAQEIAAANYDGIEVGAGIVDAYSTNEVNDILAQTGLTLPGVHGVYTDFANPERVDQFLQFLNAVGGKYLICSGVCLGFLPSKEEGLAVYQSAAETFNKVGQRCQEQGITFCYHNHDFEFEEFAGTKGIHRLAELTDPDLVKFNIDVYWVTIGGEDPAEFLHRYADRAGYYHFKDGAPGSFIELGQGIVDLVSARQAALEVGADWIVCEQDTTEKEVKVSITESREYLRSIGW